MQEAYLKDLLTANNAVPMNELPGYPTPADFAGTCYVQIPSSVLEDLGYLVHQRLLDVMGNEPRKVRCEGVLGKSFWEHHHSH